jgi:hypothetical protein
MRFDHRRILRLDWQAKLGRVPEESLAREEIPQRVEVQAREEVLAHELGSGERFEAIEKKRQACLRQVRCRLAMSSLQVCCKLATGSMLVRSKLALSSLPVC